MTEKGAQRTQLGDLLLRLRTAKGWTLRDVEARSGGRLKSSHVSQLEKGKIKDPSLGVLRSISRTFSIGFSDLLAQLRLTEDEDEVAGISEDSRVALAYFTSLTDEGRKEALSFMRWRIGASETADDVTSTSDTTGTPRRE